jgi:hypothetical protein
VHTRSEQELLRRWLDLLLETDPDLVIGYNIINFDLPYLYERATVSGGWMQLRVLYSCRDLACWKAQGCSNAGLSHATFTIPNSSTVHEWYRQISVAPGDPRTAQYSGQLSDGEGCMISYMTRRHLG